MEARDAGKMMTQENESQLDADDCSNAQGTSFDACSHCDHFVCFQRQRSVEHDEILASCLCYTFSSQDEQAAPVHNCDIVQIISSWSTKNDGVIQVNNSAVSATGCINKDSQSGNAYFICLAPKKQDVHTKNAEMLALTSCQRGDFDRADLSQAEKFLTVVKENDEYIVKEINGNRDDTVWAFERATKDSTTSSGGSTSREWRLRVARISGSTSNEKLYLAATRCGKLYLHSDDKLDGDDGNDSCRNPQTYFYLYKTLHVPSSN